MRTTTKITITIKNETVKRLTDFSKKNSINKSALIDRLINEEIDKKEFK